MFTRNRLASALLAALLATGAGTALAEPDPQRSVKVNLPADSPVSLLSSEWGESRSSEQGSAQVLQLNTALSLKNTSNRRIRAITWMVQSHEATLGGRASVTKASLDVGPGETFPLRIDLRLLRPVALAASGPAVEIALDGVLFDDLGFSGPNKLDSRRAMVAFEMEAQRDRKHFLQVLRAQGPEALRQECVASLNRQSEIPRVDVQLARGRVSAVDAGKPAEFAFLRFPDAPVEPVSGMAHLAGAEARAPKLELVNRSQRAVSYVEVGWIVKDARGRQFLGGAVPARTSIAPGAHAQVLETASLRFADPGGAPVSIDSMTGYVSQVGFADNTVWIPQRDARLEKMIAPSAEEQRLTGIYHKKGLRALIEELKKFGAAQ
ncbi:MAG: hypothetical protein U0Q16_15055 [Bryobacteraceae bacterium]